MAGIWVYGDNHEQCLELLNIGRSLAERTGTPLSVLAGDGGEASDYIARGADEVLLLPVLGDGRSHDAYIPVMAEEARRVGPDVFLLAATSRGKEMASRLAVRLGTGLCSGCVSLDFTESPEMIEMQRHAFGGAALQRVTCAGRPVMATIPLRTYDPAAARTGREGTVRELPVPRPSAVRIIERRVRERETRDITEAQIVVAVGRGFEKPEDLSLARDIAAVLGGEIGCTRPISDEQHWLPEELCIGLSGVEIRPDLYLGLGISGQVQHVTGIRNARVIAAVNKDEQAPIFDVADCGIVGDLYDVVPALIKELSEK
ncbi:MAG: electron transfer flavoprotein subunit alpha/FixB family protein [Syntrophales bacterium]|jgi:electron transfer flavoprotein alpha subunit|nr:electron transfer flavoprotein subunit alpha/FixB family protein [Syntrophales bacterium]MCK9528387.1 electron transfer flavoprotein subunit alpha/FixB family protein [Syntrophales bacterium]MDX9922688.1 electron transfer flavoprotein subunit alpha/FixB family protein [Syntrophales bacterium]